MQEMKRPTPTQKTPAMRYLEARGIPYRVFRHPEPPKSLEEAARARGQVVEQVIRSILFRGGGRYILLLLPGGYRAAWPNLRCTLGLRRLTLATPEEVLHITGAKVGAVAPWGWPHPPEVVLVDEAAFAYPEVSTGSGLPGVALILRTEDFRRSLPDHAQIGRFGERKGPQAPHGPSSGVQ